MGQYNQSHQDSRVEHLPGKMIKSHPVLAQRHAYRAAAILTRCWMPRKHSPYCCMHGMGGGGTSSIRPPSLGTLTFQMRNLLARLGSCLVTYIYKDHTDPSVYDKREAVL